VAHDDAAVGEEILDVAKTEAEAKVQPHGVGDHLGWEAMAALERHHDGGATGHPASLLAAQLDNSRTDSTACRYEPDLASRLLDGHVDTVLVATGYRPSVGYLAETVALSSEGQPLQRGGASTTANGVFYVGIPFQCNCASATSREVGADAERVVRLIRKRLDAPKPVLRTTQDRARTLHFAFRATPRLETLADNPRVGPLSGRSHTFPSAPDPTDLPIVTGCPARMMPSGCMNAPARTSRNARDGRCERM
jgi:hypothetical protein